MPQVHRVLAPQITAKWLNGQVSNTLLTQLARELEYHQQRNITARQSHNKATRRKLRQKGIKLSETLRCEPPD